MDGGRQARIVWLGGGRRFVVGSPGHKLAKVSGLQAGLPNPGRLFHVGWASLIERPAGGVVLKTFWKKELHFPVQPKKYAQIDIHVPIRKNGLLEQALAKVNEDIEVKTLWRVINVNAIDRLGMSDHGPVHFQIVANIALRLARILLKNNVEMSITRNYDLSKDYAELVVFLASLLHDLGMSISREGHEEFSLFLAKDILHRSLEFLPIEDRTIVTSEVLHAIISHRTGGTPYTVEAGIVRVADALDLSEGRSRIPYEAGKVDIHSVSALAIDNVEILEGQDKPIQINIWMNNTAGLFQVDELLKRKLMGSGIEKYVKVNAYIKLAEEKRLLKEFEIS